MRDVFVVKSSRNECWIGRSRPLSDPYSIWVGVVWLSRAWLFRMEEDAYIVGRQEYPGKFVIETYPIEHFTVLKLLEQI